MNKQGMVWMIVVALVAGGGGYWLARLQAPEQQTAQVNPDERKPLFYRNPMNPAITSPMPAQDEMGMDYIPVYAEDDKTAKKSPLFYRNPMNPAITSPVPAQDEMGMDYIPVYADEADGAEAAGTVKIDPVTVQNIGVRSAKAERRSLSHSIQAVGRITYNEERLTRLHPKVEGWIENLFVAKTGEAVSKDTMLLNIYSPRLVSTQEEYLLALANYEALKDSPFEDIRKGAVDLKQSALERLQLLDVPAHQLAELEQSRKVKKNLHIHSPFDGVVMKLGVSEGQFVTPQNELYMLADLSRVWVYVDVYENELPWIKLGDKAQMQLRAVPGKSFKGEVTYIYPYMESKTRTVRVRLEFDNPSMQLKPEMFANVTLQAGEQLEAVVVPAEAVVRSGSREQVFVVRGAGKFEPREVKVGYSSNGMTQIIEGIEAGDEVVTSAQFLIDSESKLREATAKMLEGMTPGNGNRDMSDMDMDMDDMSIKDLDMSDMSMDNMTMDNIK